MSPQFVRITARISIALMLGFTLPLQTAQAAMVGTSQVAVQASPDQRARVIDFLERQDVRQALENYGVSASDAQARVAAMTDEEVASLDKKIADLPAGGDASVLGVLFAIFIILLITDILGLTKIFPFTRSVR